MTHASSTKTQNETGIRQSFSDFSDDAGGGGACGDVENLLRS